MVTEIMKMFAKEGLGDELESALTDAVHLLTDHPECHGVRVYRQVEDPSVFVFEATWSSVEGHQAWADSDARLRFRERLGELRDSKPSELAHYAAVVDESS